MGSLDLLIYNEGLPITAEDPVSSSAGGAAVAMVSMARALHGIGHRVTVACSADQERETEGVRYVPASSLGADLSGLRCDVLLVSSSYSVLARPARAGLIGLWPHMPPLVDQIPDLRLALAKASFLFFLSRYQRDAFESVFPGVSRLGLLTTNGVDFDAIEQAAQDAPVRPGNLRFLYAARPERGLDVLLEEIWPRVHARYPEAELLVMTYHNPDVAHLEMLNRFYRACEEKVRRSPGVRSLGPLRQRDFWRQLAGCTALLYPATAYETCSLLTLEAQALGIPVIATDSTGLHETVITEETRIPGEARSPAYAEHFAGVVSRLVEDASFAARVRATLRERVRRETYDWRAVAVQWTGEFERLLREPSKRPRISAVVLAGDEGARLRTCIESLGEAVDEIVLGVEASAAATLATAESLGFQRHGSHPAEAPQRILVPITFRDFSQARNELAAQAGGDHLFWLDTDETLAGGEHLRSWVETNQYYQGFQIERKNTAVDASLESDWPVRCFRRQGPGGPFRWSGCVGEMVRGEADRPLEPVLRIPDLFLIHTGHLHRDLRWRKLAERDLPLLVKDRIENPDRVAGLLLGMRMVLELASRELAATGGVLTAKACRLLNRGFEIWQMNRHRPGFADDPSAFMVSREILKLLAQHGQPLRSTGRVPLWAEVRLAGASPDLAAPPDPVSLAAFFATREELEDFVLRQTRTIGAALEDFRYLPPPDPIYLDNVPSFEHLELPPELFGLDP